MTPEYSDKESVPERVLHETEIEERERPYVQDDNELRAPGQLCARCGQGITASQDVRRLPDGNFVHEVCPDGEV
jgi:ribosomal protein S27AE